MHRFFRCFEPVFWWYFRFVLQAETKCLRITIRPVEHGLSKQWQAENFGAGLLSRGVSVSNATVKAEHARFDGAKRDYLWMQRCVAILRPQYHG